LELPDIENGTSMEKESEFTRPIIVDAVAMKILQLPSPTNLYYFEIFGRYLTNYASGNIRSRVSPSRLRGNKLEYMTLFTHLIHSSEKIFGQTHSTCTSAANIQDSGIKRKPNYPQGLVNKSLGGKGVVQARYQKGESYKKLK